MALKTGELELVFVALSDEGVGPWHVEAQVIKRSDSIRAARCRRTDDLPSRGAGEDRERDLAVYDLGVHMIANAYFKPDGRPNRIWNADSRRLLHEDELSFCHVRPPRSRCGWTQRWRAPALRS